jgi:phage terminase small subunit
MASTQPEQPKSIPAPSHLSASSRSLWSDIVPRRGRSPERLALLTTALESRDLVDACQEQIRRDGMTTTTASTGMSHVHPLLKISKEANLIFIRAWSALGLEFDPETDSPPGSIYGIKV